MISARLAIREAELIVSREERMAEERAQLWLALLYLALTVVMSTLMGAHLWRARGARLGTWQGGRWSQ